MGGSPVALTDRPFHSRAAILHAVPDAEGYIARVCFKTGPPRHVGVELEWTVHHLDDPARPLLLSALRKALGPHAPHTLDPHSPCHPLPSGGIVTVEPGGQVEISTPPATSLTDLHQRTDSDIAALTKLLARQGLVLGTSGIDPHRAPTPVVDTPRYAAMMHAFAPRGPDGDIMMRSTAGLQVCVDAGEGQQPAARWRALHALGPALLAAFATAGRHAGHDTGSASARVLAWLAIDPGRTAPVWSADRPGQSSTGEVAAAWARYALAAPLLCVRRDHAPWTAPPGVTFADWIGGALPDPPTYDDLDYHLGTLFPPVRPRGYLEVRYLDTQPPGEWIAPAAVLAALLADPATLDEAVDRAGPAIDRWGDAARNGLGDPAVADAARWVLDLAVKRLSDTDLPAATRQRVDEIVRRRLAVAEGGTTS
jgi:glutamate--cysteine ligase